MESYDNRFMKKHISHLLIFPICMLCLFLWMQPSISQASKDNQDTIYIGVLAKDGKQACFSRWEPTAEYLEMTTDCVVQIVCLEYGELPAAVDEGQVDFTITNPSLYVDLESRFGATRITTLKNRRLGVGHIRFGGVIFRRSDRIDMQTLEDLKGKKFMAVDELAFGGWLVSLRYLLEKGVNPYKDFKELLFGGRHDAVVFAVQNGVADAGAIRTDTLERLDRRGEIDLEDFTVFTDITDKKREFPFLLTTRLYPEWPLAKMEHTKEHVAKAVGLAMLKMKPNSRAAIASSSMGWTIPLDYHSVHECLKILKKGPYKDLGVITWRQLYRQYRSWIFGGLVIVLLLSGAVSHVFLLNRRLHATMVLLDLEDRRRQQVIADLDEFKLTLDHTHDCVFMFTPDTLFFTYANQGAVHQVGYTYEELIKMTPVQIKPEITEFAFRDMIAPLFLDPAQSLTFATTHQAKDGSLIPVEIMLQYITPGGKEGRFVAIVRDITERLQEQKDKEQLQVKLLSEKKLASIGQLAAGIAHEINTPIQYIDTNIDFLRDGFVDLKTLIKSYDVLLEELKKEDIPSELLQSTDDVRKATDWEYLEKEIPSALEQSHLGVQQISSIILAMQEFSHPGSKHKEQTDLNKLLETTLTVASNEWKYIADVTIDFDESLPTSFCQHNEMGQVFLNILINGAHSISEKMGKDSTQEKGRITITSMWSDGQIEIRISDTGGGISDEIKDRIFDPFFTTKEVGEGVGQGLAIAHDIVVNKHNGSLKVESGHDGGATFIIRLPLEEEGTSL